MSRLASTDKARGVVVAKPKADAYTALLGIALAAILLGILCLCLEMSRYNWDYKATGMISAPNRGATGQFTASSAVFGSTASTA